MDWNLPRDHPDHFYLVASLTWCVDWNGHQYFQIRLEKLSHRSRGMWIEICTKADCHRKYVMSYRASGVWIEIMPWSRCPAYLQSYRASDMWIEIHLNFVWNKKSIVILRVRYVDWNRCLWPKRFWNQGRIAMRCVDWNGIGLESMIISCLSYRSSGMWIEIWIGRSKRIAITVISRKRYADLNLKPIYLLPHPFIPILVLTH